ncbi:MAG: hypothetical protein OEY58_22300 [Gammaproteobacteria bacterium]|nr:hypothetical protein [Gammaproteobacteria bacterium]
MSFRVNPSDLYLAIRGRAVSRWVPGWVLYPLAAAVFGLMVVGFALGGFL